jgi:hypothetical protein
VVAGGRFTAADGKPAPGLAYWDGFSWNPLDTGVHGADSTVYALASTGDALYAGGSFSFAGSTVSANIARWNEDIPVRVWPGDCNDDGTVDGHDLLPIGRYWQLSAGTRVPVSRLASGMLPIEQRTRARGCRWVGPIDAADVNALVVNWRCTRYDAGPSVNATPPVPKSGDGSRGPRPLATRS